MAKKTAKKSAGKKKSTRSTARRATPQPSPLKKARAALIKWVGGLDLNELAKMTSLKVIVEDPCTCERIPDPTKTECEWTVKWMNNKQP